MVQVLDGHLYLPDDVVRHVARQTRQIGVIGCYSDRLGCSTRLQVSDRWGIGEDHFLVLHDLVMDALMSHCGLDQ